MAKKKRLKDATYRITFAGQYFTLDNRQASYEMECLMKSEHIEGEFHNALSVFKNHIAPDEMPKKYPDYVGLATHRVIKQENMTRPGELAESLVIMTRAQLLDYIKENELPVKTAMYRDDGALRQAITDCEDDEDIFTKNQDVMYGKKKANMDMEESVRLLNELKPDGKPQGRPLIDVLDDVPPFVPPAKPVTTDHTPPDETRTTKKTPSNPLDKV